MIDLNEAFKTLERLDEDTFNITSSGEIDELKTFLDQDDGDIINVIDPEAENEDELKDEYLDKVVTECTVCHSLIYKDEDALEFDDEQDVVNISEECPYCFSTDGFKIVGKIKPYVRKEDKEEVKVEVDGDEVEVEEKDDEDLKESLKNLKYRAKRKNMPEFFDVNAQGQTIGVGVGGGTGQTFGDAGKAANIGGLDVPNIGEACEDEECDEELGIGAGLALGGAALGAGLVGSKLLDSCETENKEELKEETVGQDLSEYQKWVDYDMDKYGKVSQLTRHKIKKAGLEIVEDEYGDYEVIAKREDESLEEGFNNVEIETDDYHMSMTADEDGKTTVTTEPIKNEEVEDAEMIAPLDDEEVVDIEAEAEEEDVPEEDASEEDTSEEEEVEIEDVDEESMNELGESYLKKVYDNVDSFKTTRIEDRNNKLFVEGLIKFNSGNTKKTTFIFEGYKINGNDLIFRGCNKEICRGNKSFTLKGKLNNNSLICESLTYNYNQDKNRIYGKVSRKG